ncbi:plasma protease C1 inhibitor isoform X2 [Spea bombifrons]|uniref:plasma protease C1 inhibitor isoform X2 n=1 Tax=Spea bombifrons TaxID=233779 RepID=UPI00234B7751|nr:plasma protease C1 inhibitor isoform X2 [Spea bombifrons]
MQLFNFALCLTLILAPIVPAEEEHDHEPKVFTEQPHKETRTPQCSVPTNHLLNKGTEAKDTVLFEPQETESATQKSKGVAVVTNGSYQDAEILVIDREISTEIETLRETGIGNETTPPEHDEPETNTDRTALTPTTSSCSTMWPECERDLIANATEQVSEALTRFSLDMYKILLQQDSQSNLVVAPVSIVLALSHLMLGTGKETRDVMLKTMYKGVKDTQCVHEAIMRLFNKDLFLSASEVFYKKDLSLTAEFHNQSMKYYESGGQELLNDPKTSLKQINTWVSEKTAQHIPELLKKLPHDLQLLLVNVLYYQGKWLTCFDPTLTKKESFNRPGLSSVKVPMMNSHKFPLQSIRDKYLKAQVARFPLTNNISLLIILPHPSESLKKVGTRLTEEAVRILIKELQDIPPRSTFVSLPHLKLDWSNELAEVLSKLDLDNLFYGPDLCGLSPEPDLAVNDVYHRAVLEVTEEGVSAIAASSVAVARTVNVFAVKRPFIFILASDISKIPLYIGHVTDPSQ